MVNLEGVTSMLINTIRCLSLCLIFATASAEEYKMYKVDWKPVESMKAQMEELKALQKANRESLTVEDLGKLVQLLDSMIEKHPEWVDGYWQFAAASFEQASSYNDEKDHPKARAILVKGQSATEKCLKVEPKNPLCKFFKGSMIAKIASIDGIFSALREAENVEKLWLEAANSGYDYKFQPNISMQGSVRYALGLFYRLVPDFYLVELFFNVRGNIEKSIVYHRGSVKVDGENSCNMLMLSVAMICKEEGSKQTKIGQEGFAWLDKTATNKAPTPPLKICKSDAVKIKADPTMSCGYTMAKQQETDPDKVKEMSH